MMGHFKEVCSSCRKVLRQCRCPGPKTTTFTLCDSCARKPQVDDSNDPGGRVRLYMKLWRAQRCLMDPQVLREVVQMMIADRLMSMRATILPDEQELIDRLQHEESLA